MKWATAHHRRHAVTCWSHQVLRVRVSRDILHASISLSHHPVVSLKTLVRVCNPIIVLVSLVLHEVLLLININSVLVLMISF